MSKTYDNVKDAKEALKKAPSGSMILAKGKPGNETFKIVQIGPGPGGTIVKKAEGGMMNKSLKPVDKKKNPGLAKLPTGVRNKMGYMAKGGMARRDKDEEKALKGIEKQQESQAKRAEQAHKDVREYVRKKARTKKANGGMVLEIGLRPATKSEMKMAKEMKKPVKKAGGGMVSRGSGAAIRGNKFKGVF